MEQKTQQEKEQLLKRALEWIKDKANDPVILNLNMTLAVGLIGQLQLAFRHPGNTGPTREHLERLVYSMIDQIDPAHGEIYEFLMLGFDKNFDM